MKPKFSLHRSGKKADWDKVSRRQWNVWQRFAGNSGGALTLGNAFTVGGLSLVLVGLSLVLSEAYGWGFGFIVVGRLCDLADGWLADRTHTKSPLGEMLDSVADKLATGISLVVLVIADVVPMVVALLILATQLVIVALFFVRRFQGRRLPPSRLGKISMASAWVGLGMFVAAMALSGVSADLATNVAYVFSYASCLLALGALRGYIIAV